MTLRQLRRLHQARPFVSFRVNLADGRSIAIEHPEVMAIIPPGRTVFIGLADGGFELVDLRLVTSLGQQNGTHRRRRS